MAIEMPTYKIPFEPVVNLFNRSVEAGVIKQFPGTKKVDMRGCIETFDITFRNEFTRLNSVTACGYILRLRGEHVDVRFYLNAGGNPSKFSYDLNLNLGYYPRYQLIDYRVYARKNVKKAEDELTLFLLTNCF